MATATAIILTYERLPMLKQALACARWQTHADLEILVVVNGGSDETLAWLSAVDDPRLRVIALPENISPPRARNVGLQAATGQWVGFLDDDDLWAPDKVELMVGEGERQGRGWAYCGAVYIDPHGEAIMGRPPLPLSQVVHDLPVLYTVPGGLSGMMWRHDAMGEDRLVDESMTYCNDWDIALRLLSTGPPVAVERPLVGYRLHPGAWSGKVGDQQYEFDMIAEKHKALRGRRRVHKGEHYRYVAAQASRAGQRRAAVWLYLRALMYGDVRSIPRLFGALLPPRLQAIARERLLSNQSWLEEGRAWVAKVPHHT